MNLDKKKVIILIAIVAVTLVIAGGIRLAQTGEAGPADDLAGIILTPIQNGIGIVSGKIAGFFGYFTDVDQLRVENKELQTQVNELQEQLGDYDRYKGENDRLKNYLGIKEKNPDFVFEMADITAREPNNWFNVFTINKGEKDGIAPQCTVITSDGLVGYVFAVGANWSKVVTILDPQCVFGVTVSRTKEVAVIEGDDELKDDGLCKMSLLPPNNTVQKGDVVITSGLGEIFPAGIKAGTVKEVFPEASGIASYAVIEPAVDLMEIKEVMVIIGFQEEK